jgi:ABC-type branched-subunit amino acid transport system substrate-binding protein
MGGAGATVGLAGCISDLTGGGGKVVFGQPAALTGKWDYLQESVTRVSKMAKEDINDAGGINGKTLEISRRDTGVNPQKARTVTKQLINQDSAVALLGLFSSEIVPLWDYIQGLETPIVTPWPGSRFLDNNGGDKMTPDDLSDDEWLWRTIIHDSVHTAGAALTAADTAETVAVVHGSSAGETGWAEAFADAIEVIDGIEIVKTLEVAEGKTTYQSEVSRLFESEFDAWALALGAKDAITLMRNWIEGGYGRPLIGEDTLAQAEVYNTLGDKLSQVDVRVAKPSSSGPVAETVTSRFEERWPDVDLNPWGLSSYEAVIVPALAAQRAGSTDPKEIEKNIGPVARPPGKKVETFEAGKKALDNDEEINFQGAGSTVNFTGDGNVVGPTVVESVTPDGAKEVATVSEERVKKVLTDSNYGK